MLNRVATREEGIESPRPEGSILAEGSQPRPMGGSWILPELVVQTGAPDVVLQVDVAIRKSPTRAAYHARATGERVPVAEVNVEELALRGPAVTQCVFDATTDRPPATRIGLQGAGVLGKVGEPLRAVDLRPRAAARDVQHRIGSKPPEVGQAEPAAGRHQPTLL